MRKLLLTLVLPLLLLLSQQGAVVHELGHLADAVSREGGPASPSHQAGDLQCQACLAFAHLAGVATALAVPAALPSFRFAKPVGESPAVIAADAPRARSRGPPIV